MKYSLNKIVLIILSLLIAGCSIGDDKGHSTISSNETVNQGHIKNIDANILVLKPAESPSYFNALINALDEDGTTIKIILWDEIEKIDIKETDLIILPDASKTPIGLSGILRKHIRAGGSVMTLGGPIFGETNQKDDLLVIDGLSPEYKFFPLTNAISIRAGDNQVFVPDVEYTICRELFSPSPRAQGTGYNKNRDSRFIPLIEVYDEKGMKSGYAAWMHINGLRADNPGSVIAGFGTVDDSFYDENGLKAVNSVAKTIVGGTYLLEGGASEFAYFADDNNWILGAKVMGDKRIQEELTVVITIEEDGEKVYEKFFEVDWKGKSAFMNDIIYHSFEDEFYPSSTKTHVITTELISENKLLDKLIHEVSVWEPKLEEDRKYVTVKNNDFYKDGSPLNLFGINYIPSSGIAVENVNYLVGYFLDFAYDPDVIQADLERIKDIGFNAVSVFINSFKEVNSNGLLDFLIRTRKMDLYVDISIREFDSMHSVNFDELEKIITKYRLWEHDHIVAFDIAWETDFGNYEPTYSNRMGRKAFDKDWEKWIINRYGNIKNAEEDWGYLVSRIGGQVVGASDEQLSKSGSWDKMIAAYRRFSDDFVSKKHSDTREFLKSIVPNHLVSFRKHYAGIPTIDPGSFGYDFRSFASSLDFISSVGYLLGAEGNWDDLKNGVFTSTYAYYNLPGATMVWKEFGKHVWAGTNFNDEINLYHLYEESQAQYYRNFFDMAIMGYSSGVYAWYYPGGYRLDEKSDYGIINPDGSDRLVTKILREYSDKFINRPSRPEVDYQIEIDRDSYPTGIVGIYKDIYSEFWDAINSGKTVGFKDIGVGKTSIDVPLVSVGNGMYNGNNLIKHLNGEFWYLKIKDVNGEWIDALKNDKIYVTKGEPIFADIKLANTQSATFISPEGFSDKKGTVFIKSTSESTLDFEIPIYKNLAYREKLEISQALLSDGISENENISLRLNAKGRCYFGEKVEFQLIPAE